ncbi:MAG: ChbG/HpnK family deacetylase, partial [Candidatus Omnitrophica bacterium]|nr:ChbG/HpnK family deacetylase [Candidatus Omnitrophota bacterium]
VHLTLTSEFSKLHYGPISSIKDVPSLINKKGYFHKTIRSLSKYAKQEEVKIELENQIKKVIKCNLIPTHLDCHMFALHFEVTGRTDFLPVILYLCRKFDLPFRSPFLKEKAFLEKNNTKVLFKSFKESYDIPARKKKLRYDNWLKRLPYGVSELILHCGYNDFELRTITKKSLRRQCDFDYAVSNDTKSLLRQKNIELIPWEKAYSHI